jgi:hypothetical protein
VTQATLKRGHLQVRAAMTREQLATFEQLFAGEHPGADIGIFTENLSKLSGAPNRLFGAYIKEDGDAA